MRLTASGLAVGPIRDLFQSQLQKFDQNKSFTSEMIQYAKQNLMVFVVDDFLGSAEKEHMHIFPHVLEVDNVCVYLLVSVLILHSLLQKLACDNRKNMEVHWLAGLHLCFMQSSRLLRHLLVMVWFV